MQEIKINLVSSIPPLPIVKDKTQVDVRYVVLSPYVSVHVYWSNTDKELKYEVEEPILNENQKELLKKVEDAMVEMINVNVIVDNTQEALVKYINKTARDLIDQLGLGVSEDDFYKIFYYLYRNFVGLNEIEPLIKDYFIEDIECNGFGTPIYIVHRVYKNIKTNIIFNDVERLTSFVEKISQRCGKYISYATPIMDGSLPDGSRVNATYTAEISSRGPTFTIRKFTKIPWTPTQLINFNTLSPEMLAYLWILIQYKNNILIAGGTASGKTTLLNAIAFFISPESRVVSIEDTRELSLFRENWLPSVARSSVGVGNIGEVSLFNLLKSSFRQNPDYVIVGEVRGEEASVLFQGMASGHSSLSTIHADSVDTLIKRLETPPINLSPTLINTIDCVTIMTHAVVGQQETRKLREIVEIVNVNPDGIAITNTPFVWNSRDNKFYFKKASHVFEKISKRYGFTIEELEKEFKNRTLLLNELVKRKISNYKEIQEIVNHYYKSPEAVLRAFG
ncbi:type II/IV secretion system ATPase subunit, partial [Candidatus Pacearchaeota archaeon]|nr:type II/IV secretion system ATPase subunit [Candidatus Pacearchaeota archaeon]